MINFINRLIVIKNDLWNIETLFSKSILKKCPHFCHSFSNVSGLLSHSFLQNHVAATLPFLNLCSSNKEWFFFWEIVQSISLFLKFLRQNFHVTPSELFIDPLHQNQYDFVAVKTFEAGKDIPQQPFVFWK